MDNKKFQTYKQEFTRALRQVLSEQGNNPQMSEAAFPAYSDNNPLIRFLFWRRLWVTVNFLQLQGPYEAVLDFGCGSAVALPLLTSFSKRVIGLDIDLTPFYALSSFFSFPDEVEVYQTEKRPLSSFSDNSFDVIISLDVLEHVNNLQELFVEFCRIIKPGGRIIVSGPTENLFYRIGRKFAGETYTGDYHITNIHNVYNIMRGFMKTKTLATLYYPFPLFKIFVGCIEK